MGGGVVSTDSGGEGGEGLLRKHQFCLETRKKIFDFFPKKSNFLVLSDIYSKRVTFGNNGDSITNSLQRLIRENKTNVPK